MNKYEIAKRFAAHLPGRVFNATTDGTGYVLHRSTIARWVSADTLVFDWCGFYTTTTASHMNQLLAALGIPQSVSHARARDRGDTTFVVLTTHKCIAEVEASL